jgi:hypothetical protein
MVIAPKSPTASVASVISPAPAKDVDGMLDECPHNLDELFAGGADPNSAAG